MPYYTVIKQLPHDLYILLKKQSIKMTYNRAIIDLTRKLTMLILIYQALVATPTTSGHTLQSYNLVTTTPKLRKQLAE